MDYIVFNKHMTKGFHIHDVQSENIEVSLGIRQDMCHTCKQYWASNYKNNLTANKFKVFGTSGHKNPNIISFM